MSNKEEFLAYLKQASETVGKWPEWKKSGLNAPDLTVKTSSVLIRTPNIKPVVAQSSNGK